MSETIPLFPKAANILVHSGNIVNWNKLKRKSNHTPTEEICECVSDCLSKYLETADRNELQYVTELVCENKEFREIAQAEKRDELKITVKVVLYNRDSPEVLEEAVNKAMSEMGVSFVETVLLAIPESDAEVTLDVMKPLWTVLETLVQQEKVFSLGICDLDKTHFEDLFLWATVKPIINQVNLASCCVMPQDLRDFAKQHNVQLLTHNDAPDVLPQQSLQDAIKTSSTEKDGEFWEPSWISRYSAIVKYRGIIQKKGYVIKLTRDIKRRS